MDCRSWLLPAKVLLCCCHAHKLACGNRTPVKTCLQIQHTTQVHKVSTKFFCTFVRAWNQHVGNELTITPRLVEKFSWYYYQNAVRPFQQVDITVIWVSLCPVWQRYFRAYTVACSCMFNSCSPKLLLQMANICKLLNLHVWLPFTAKEYVHGGTKSCVYRDNTHVARDTG